MSDFNNYIDPNVTTEELLQQEFKRTNVYQGQRESIVAFLQPLKIKDIATYEHDVRVGVLSRRIGDCTCLDQRALLYAGLLHDVGKAQTRLETLRKTADWTPADTREVKRHVIDGFRLLRGYFDFSAQIILWHHRFQANGYPKKIPAPLHDYSMGTGTMIAMYGRLLALADCFDALHRVNEKFGAKQALTRGQIKEKMLALNPDQRKLIERLYNVCIFV